MVPIFVCAFFSSPALKKTWIDDGRPMVSGDGGGRPLMASVLLHGGGSSRSAGWSDAQGGFP